MGKVLKKFLKWTFGTLGALLILVVGIVLLVWCYPEKILTSERVSGWVAPFVRFDRKNDLPFPNAPLVTFEIKKDGFTRRSFQIALRPGCYSPAGDPPGRTEVCLETANLGVSLRLSRSTGFKVTELDHIELHVSHGRLVPGKAAKPKTKSPQASSWLKYLKYLDRDFRWGPIGIQIDDFELPDSPLKITGNIRSEGTKLTVSATAESPTWVGGFDGKLFKSADDLVIPNASVSYRTKKSKGKEDSLALAGEVGAKYGLTTNDLDATFAVKWRNPSPAIETLQVDDGTFRMRKDALTARATVKALLKGKTPLGRLPILSVNVTAEMKPGESSGSHPIDFGLGIESYEFSGIHVHSDLEVTLVPTKLGNEIRWRKGELRIETPDLSKTTRMLVRTSWAIPVPFNVFHGPLAFHTEPFQVGADRTTLPVALSTNLTSTEQALVTETHAEVDLAKMDFSILDIRVKAVLKKVQFRLPDYEPLAPIPAVARDPRIVRYEEPKKTLKGAGAAPAATIPIHFSVQGPPGSVVLLNRFFIPSFSSGINLESDSKTGALKGMVSLSEPFDIHYLNHEIRLDQFELKLRPTVEVTAMVSMERSGYRIEARLHQAAGKTQIQLTSVPPLSNDEIVSLILYGMPKNSISSEQTRSVGSTQAAMSSEALGIFSFWAFASTPIESVLYDPETQTYSAVVRLPGGLVASIGSNWDNERQLALSKSLGRNWAVSTELIKDATGVDRGGTLLRWRKSY